MLTEPQANPVESALEHLDVVVLVVPENTPPARIADVLAEFSARDHPVLVVLPRGTGAPTLHRHDNPHVDGRLDDDPLDALWRSRSARR